MDEMAMRALEKGWALGPGTPVKTAPVVRRARRRRVRRRLPRASLLLAAILQATGERAIALAARLAH